MTVPRLLLAARHEPTYIPEGLEPCWRDHAACLGMDPDLFFPGTGHSPEPALRVCATCTVRNQCLEDGLHEPTGIYGGLTPVERRKERRRRNGTRRRPTLGTGTDPVLNYLADIGGTWNGTVTALADELDNPSRASAQMMIANRRNKGLITYEDGTGRGTSAIHLTAAGWTAIERNPK